MVEVVVQLADTRISTGDLLGLRVGDIITTEKDVHEPLEIQVEGILNFAPRPEPSRGIKQFKSTRPSGLCLRQPFD